MQVMSFSTSAADQAKAALAQQQAEDAARASQQLVTTLVWAGVLLLIAVAVLILWLRARRRAEREPVDLEGELLTDDVRAIESAGPDVADPTMVLPVLRVTPEPAVVPELPGPSEEVLDAERRRAQVNQLGVSEPLKTAELLRALMDERQPV